MRHIFCESTSVRQTIEQVFEYHFRKWSLWHSVKLSFFKSSAPSFDCSVIQASHYRITRYLLEKKKSSFQIVGILLKI